MVEISRCNTPTLGAFMGGGDSKVALLLFLLSCIFPRHPINYNAVPFFLIPTLCFLFIFSLPYFNLLEKAHICCLHLSTLIGCNNLAFLFVFAIQSTNFIVFPQDKLTWEDLELPITKLMTKAINKSINSLFRGKLKGGAGCG